MITELLLRFSGKTLAALCRALTAVVHSHAEMDLLFLEHGLTAKSTAGGLQVRANALVLAARDRQAEDPRDAERMLTEIAEYVLGHGAFYAAQNYQLIERLQRALSVDGIEWREGRLIPTTPAPAQLAPELSLLEQDLQELDLTVAAEHYRQAHESLVAGNREAANSQVRSFLENLLIELGERRTSPSHRRSNASAALQDLRDGGFFDNAENHMIKNFWQGIQDNGPHHGLTDEQEALFRLHVATAIARYALHKHRAGSS